jgi:hypothetical protein
MHAEIIEYQEGVSSLISWNFERIQVTNELNDILRKMNVRFRKNMKLQRTSSSLWATFRHADLLRNS